MEHPQCLIQLIFILALQSWEIGLSVPVLCRAVGACCSGSCSADSSGMKKNSATSPSSAAASAAAASAAVSAMAGYDLTNPHSLLVAGNPETLGMMPPPPHHHQHMQHQHQVKRCMYSVPRSAFCATFTQLRYYFEGPCKHELERRVAHFRFCVVSSNVKP